ncbi:hypothetical protein NLM27_08915 [Bradyrhizobium sp. CCGB12]|uniref:hypothetical protein n=1 Tax=Bradyrhizobium sp. CCGB12 TaxID=2949632 RepID=UPI0020B1E419|nr:hypothetical protein [Bradyrhizobium sp. CCGB12]MCP3388893.1 hypothetical protein [Bradyrhizobium sp. CCGB12]
MTTEKPQLATEAPNITLAEFFESVPPNTRTTIADLYLIGHRSNPSSGPVYTFDLPGILIHCTDDICNGPRIHRAVSDGSVTITGGISHRFLEFLCSNCRRQRKMFAVRLFAIGTEKHGQVTKLGEFPPYGPTTPTRLLKLLGDEREVFLRGRRCENQGLGIGAFSYYRRVVENQKNRIIDEILKASVTLSVTKETVDLLERAKNETQFSNSVSLVKDAIPQGLLIKGHNPITLLHTALSDGLHARSDEDCLEIAHDIRVVLAELAEKLSEVMKDEAELDTAVSRLLKPRDTK